MNILVSSLFIFLGGVILLRLYLKISKIIKIKDNNDFNVGNANTPTGSGIIFLIIFYLGSIYFFYIDENFKNLLPNRFYIFYLSIFLFGIISFYDDIKPIDPILRLIIQFLLIYLSSTCLNISSIDLPLKLSMLFSIILWIYIINITNFIDGLDGFLASHVIFFTINIILIKHYLNLEIFSYYLSIIFFPLILAFILFNKPIAKLYMGDAGSIILGYIIGFVILEIVILKEYLLAISVFIYPLMDCTITLIKKIYKGHYPWARLFDYFFLVPVIKGKKEHSYVLFINFFFSSVNLFFIYLQIKITSYFFILNFLLTLTQIVIYNKHSLKNEK